MKTHTSSFKEQIKLIGKEIDSKITFGDTVLGKDDLNAVTPSYQGAVLKSVMKQLDIDSNVAIPIGTNLKYEFGLKVNGQYEYINYGNYIVYSIEKQEDTNSYKILCYDKMLLSMKNYEKMPITYPISIRDYINAICDYLGIVFASVNDDFANFNKIISSELYFDSDGNSLDYTFRDVLDELAQVTASTICINDNDELEIRYITNALSEPKEESGSYITINSEINEKLINLEIEGKSEQDGEPTPDTPIEIESVGYENLFDGLLELGSFNSSGINVSNTNCVRTVNYIEIEPNTKYYLFSDLGYAAAIQFYDESKTFIKTSTILNSTFTTPENAKYIRWRSSGGNVENNLDVKYQLENGLVAHPYIPYEKYGIEVIHIGKNLFDKSKYTSGARLGSDGANYYEGATDYFISEYIHIQANETYTVNFSPYSMKRICYYDSAKHFINANTSDSTFTTPENAEYLRFSNLLAEIDSIQLEKGVVSTIKEEYKSSSQLIILNEPLRSLPNGIKDIAYIRNNKLYVDRYVGSVILDGSESWGTYSSQKLDNTSYFVCTVNSIFNSIKNFYSSHFVFAHIWGNDVVGLYLETTNVDNIRMRIQNSIASTPEELKTWLSNNNVLVDYELATPVTEEYGEIEMRSTFKGINHISTTDKLEPIINIKYSESFETIDEEFLKDINVNFSEKFGAINTIVLSRSADSDNIYYPEILPENPYEIKIKDNQIMNGNDRADFLPDIYNKLNGMEFYTNDFVSTGICYLDLCDKYLVKIGDNNYPCVMFNDEVLVTQGLEENIFTEKPQETETDYSKADKTDRKINQTYLIVDKQNGKIESVVSQTEAQNEKIAKVTQTVEELNSKISEVADVTVSAEDNDGQVELDNINESEPIRIVVKPIGKNITYLYPRNNLYPSNNLFPKIRTIRFTNTKKNEIVDYELPADLLYYDSDHYDEFILDYDGQSCVINKRVEYNEDGTTYILSNEKTIEFEYPRILLSDGDYSINIVGYDTAYLFVRLMAQNIYTTQFATKAELSSEISQTSEEINLEVSKKVGKEEVISSINQTAEQIKINASKININGVITAINNDSSTTINGDKIKTGTLTADQINGGTITASAINLGGGTFTASTIGTVKASSGNIAGFGLDGTSGFSSDYATLRPNGNLLLYPGYGSARYVLSNAMTFNAQNGIVIASNSNANVSAPTNNLDLKACSGATAYLACMGNSDGTNERSSVNCTDGILKFTSSGYCTYNGSTVFGSSSKATKENIIDLREEQKEEVYNLIKNIPTKQFDYKKEYGKPFNYGFIIEDIENTKLNDLLHITQAENNKNIKMYSTEDLVRLELITIQNLMKKIDELENKIKELESER